MLHTTGHPATHCRRRTNTQVAAALWHTIWMMSKQRAISNTLLLIGTAFNRASQKCVSDNLVSRYFRAIKAVGVNTKGQSRSMADKFICLNTTALHTWHGLLACEPDLFTGTAILLVPLSLALGLGGCSKTQTGMVRSSGCQRGCRWRPT